MIAVPFYFIFYPLVLTLTYTSNQPKDMFNDVGVDINKCIKIICMCCRCRICDFFFSQKSSIFLYFLCENLLCFWRTLIRGGSTTTKTNSRNYENQNICHLFNLFTPELFPFVQNIIPQQSDNTSLPAKKSMHSWETYAKQN